MKEKHLINLKKVAKIAVAALEFTEVVTSEFNGSISSNNTKIRSMWELILFEVEKEDADEDLIERYLSTLEKLVERGVDET